MPTGRRAGICLRCGVVTKVDKTEGTQKTIYVLVSIVTITEQMDCLDFKWQVYVSVDERLIPTAHV